MPYIEQDRREAIEAGEKPQNAGELCYVLYREVVGYIEEHGRRFQVFSDVYGALYGALAEVGRREVGRHEDAKLLANGDVHDD